MGEHLKFRDIACCHTAYNGLCRALIAFFFIVDRFYIALLNIMLNSLCILFVTSSLNLITIFLNKWFNF